MSASTERKNRIAAREAGTDKKTLASQEAEQKARKSKRRWIIGTVAVILFIALVLFLSSPSFYRITKAETIGSRTLSPAQVNYFKGSSGYATYAAYFGEDYASAMVDQALLRSSALLDYAKDNGISLSEAEKKEIASLAHEQIQQFAEYAKSNNVSLSTYMGYVFGSGVNESVIRSGMEDSLLAQKADFTQLCAYQPSQEELDGYYADPADGDAFTYAYYLAPASDAASVAEAHAAMQAVSMSYDAGKDDDDALTVLNDILAEEFPESNGATLRSNVVGEQVDQEYREWITAAERAEGDLMVGDKTDGSGSYVLLFLGRSDNTDPVVAVRHILIKAEADENGAYTDEAKAAAKARAEEILATWEAGGKTEAEFATLATLFSEDEGSSSNGGLYSAVTPGQMVEEFDRFCFEEHSYGDTGIVYGESDAYAGYHVMFFVEQAPARVAAARDSLRDEANSAWLQELIGDLQPVYHWAYRLVK